MAAAQNIFRSGIGIMLYLVKHSRPDILNTVRKSYKSIHGTTPTGLKELKRVIKYVIDAE